MFILSSSHLRGPLSSERCVQKGVRRLSRRRYAIRSAKVALVRLLVKNTIAKMPVDVHGSAFAVNETEAGLMLVPRLVAVGDTSDNQDAPEDSIGQGCFYLRSEERRVG